MKVYSKLALAAAVIAALPLCPLRAQIDTERPVTTQTLKNAKVVKPKWKQWRVVAATNTSLVVRDPQSERTIVTFTYSDKVRLKMQKIIDNGGYQYDDKVRIRHEDGQTIAMDLKGRPSRP
jgi:ABC-type uncharacterized transport system auxiliary subunit